MRLTPAENDRLLLYLATLLARERLARGVRLNVPEATAMIAHAACEAARDGARLAEAVAAARGVLTVDDVMPEVPGILTEVQVEAVFADGTKLIVVTDPIPGAGDAAREAPGAVLPAAGPRPEPTGQVRLSVTNTSGVPVSVTSHFHFFETNRALAFDRAAAYGHRLALPVGTTVCFDPGSTRTVELTPLGGDRRAIGFAGLVDGPLDAPGAREAALARARAAGYLFAPQEGTP
ncbi:urease subunit gamma/beta [Streptosporangium becharense]|uniref:urease n=1 Tax=Streptosporangium becharense TaxID=1816182 RepID=A0A7W9IAW3_9ACTN|nr:urease subunit gamma [Streptosporangium becharense]MBB2910612.1 urease subunit gamma/beta [Streptosporangium becharense]MBB5817308.1 urease subunit gamma/beta [Streptosporangium becharense]